MLTSILIFAVTGLLFAAIPGPDFALILRTSLLNGKKAAICSSIGIGCGLIVHTSLSVAGLTAVIAHSPFLFKCITYAGAAYLAYIGLHALLPRLFNVRAPRPAKGTEERGTTQEVQTGTYGVPPRTAFVQGFLTNVLNPKAVIFFLTFLPQFVVPGAGVSIPAQLLILGIIMVIVTAGWFVVLSVLLSHLRGYFENEIFRRWLERVTGAIFLGFSVKLLVTSS